MPSAETEIGAAFGQVDAADEFARWREHADPVVALAGASLRSLGAALGEAAWAHVHSDLTSLLRADIDDQRGTPLSVLRRCGPLLAPSLASQGVALPVRDPFEADRFPDDVYAFGPATFADLGDDVGDLGLRWSVAKAFEHKRRHLR